MKNKIISIISIVSALIIGFATYYYEVLPKWVSLLIVIVGFLPQILSWRDNGNKENENKTVLELLSENITLRKDLSKKEKGYILERTKNQE